MILGLETSCDETACAIVKDGREVLSSLLVSQCDIHERFGGVVPEVAARHHVETVNKLISMALEEAALSRDELDAIACTNGPGLIGNLLVRLSAAKALSWAWEKPLLTVDHLFSHVCANFIDTDLKPPFVCLLVSGGHTQIMHFKTFDEWSMLGQTLDDAAGEAYDKVARLLGLGYPGGPAVDRVATEGDPKRFRFPEGVVDGFDFSFSGLKTAVLRTVEKLKNESDSLPVADLAASFQDAVNRVLVKKTIAASRECGVESIVLAGGVAANRDLRSRLALAAEEGACDNECGSFKVFMPALRYCTDNAAMVASAAYFCREPAGLDAGAYSRSPYRKPRGKQPRTVVS